MRIINSKKIWDNRQHHIRKIWPVIVLYFMAILTATAVLIMAVELRPGGIKPVAIDNEQIKVSLPSTQQTKIHTINQLLPEQDNPSNSLVRLLATPPPPPTPDCAVVSCIALTFDDGPNADSTPIILDALKKQRVKATFFVIGLKVAPHKDLLIGVQKDGHEIGNHTWAHPNLTKLNRTQIEQQINQTQSAITDIGLPAPKLFRPPYEAFTKPMLAYVNMPVILWNIDPRDWREKDFKNVLAIVESQARPGGLIVMHDRPATAVAVEKIIEDLKPKFRFVTVSELLNLSSDARGIFVGR